MTTTQLVQRCLSGDANAWQQLVDRYVRLVHSIPVRHGLSPDEVSDVGQEVFIALAQHLHQIDDPERLPSWLITTARRLSWRVLQKRRNEHLGTASDIGDDPAIEQAAHQQSQPFLGSAPSINELFEGWNRQELLGKALMQIHERCRKLLTMLFLDSMEPSYDEISSELDIPKGSIGPTRNRCLQQLRTHLESMDFDDNR